MGLDYSYMLYFKKDQLADVLMGVADMAVKHEPPTTVYFPDRVVEVPLKSWWSEETILRFDDFELGFETVLVIDLDEAILDWGHSHPVGDTFRSPPEISWVEPVSVGYIYLTVFNDLSQYYPEITLDIGDLALFKFWTTGTHMSIMFAFSTSIRKRFLQLLQRFDGVCGVFNNEEEGEVFWLDGKEIHAKIDDPWTSPEEIERKISGG